MLFEGSGVAIITPFLDNGDIDYDTYTRLLEFHLDEGTDAIVVIGTTGEATTLSKDEKREIIQFTVDKIDGRIPVIAGTGGNNTREDTIWSKEVSDIGVDALLVVTPYYNKASKQGLIDHFTQIADASNAPIILYSVPGRTNVDIPVEAIVELSKHDNIIGLKDATANLNYTLHLRRLVADDFALYSGNDDIILPFMSVGGQGVISVVANAMPRETSEICHAYLKGDVKRARDIQLKMLSFIDTLFIEASPIPIKRAMSLLGFGTPELRLPLSVAEDTTTERLKTEMQKLNLI